MKWLLFLVLLAGCPRFHAGTLPGAPADATFVDVDGVQIHYRELGREDGRQAVVLIHGFGASLESWRGVHEILARHFQVIAIDLPGFGWSSRPPGDYSPVAEARMVWRALDQLGVSDAALVGHSWGSSVVLAMALEQPERVRRVALYSAYVYEAQVPSFFRWARLGGVGEALFTIWYGERMEDRVALAYHDLRYVTQARVARVEAELDKPGTYAAALAAARGQRFGALEKRWHEITQPVLLLWGDDDQVTPLRYGKRLAKELPGARLEVYPDCGHLPMVEARVPTTRDLLAFLSETSPSPLPSDPLDIPELPEMLEPGDLPPLASADVALLGAELSPRKYAAPRDRTMVDVHGNLRLRGQSLSEAGERGDARLRTDLAFHAGGTGVAVKARIDVVDREVDVQRVWGEVLTPVGILAAGRMGAHWGLGMVANGGDCDDCDGGDATDRVTLVSPLVGHLVALSYDLALGDDVTTVTAAVLRARSPAAVIRRAAAGLATLEYGGYASHRRQPTDQGLPRELTATVAGFWARVVSTHLRLEVEAVYAHARVGQPSLVPGVELTQAITSDQFGLAIESELRFGVIGLGVDAGFASGDSAPGFDDPQADPPGDTTVDHLRFHPDYRVDRILFREILGTVTDAAYLRPHASLRLAELGHAWIDATGAVIASWAVEASSTPTGARALGIELDPGLVFVSRDGFRAALEYALFLPGTAFLDADPAQLVRVRLGYFF